MVRFVPEAKANAPTVPTEKSNVPEEAVPTLRPEIPVKVARSAERRPPFTLTDPVSVFAPVKVSVPAPDLTRLRLF